MRIVSGIQPTGRLHIGNYLGALQQWIRLQENNECFFFVADLHALTIPQEPKTYQRQILELTAELLASGLNPDKCVIFVQSRVPEHLKLAWLLATVTPVAELERMTQYKEKSREKKTTNAGLFTYPILQAADILIYQPEGVPVGEDQIQHIELTRKLARKFNARFGTNLPLPRPLINPTKRLMALNNPQKKMSKSIENSYISLTDSNEEIIKKIKSAVTDEGPRGQTMSPGVKNLFLLLKVFASKKVYEQMFSEYKKGNFQYARLKEILSEVIIKQLSPIREKKNKLLKDPAYLKQVLSKGNAKAREQARATWKMLASATGLR